MDLPKIELGDILVPDTSEIEERIRARLEWTRSTLTRAEDIEDSLSRGGPVLFNTLSLPGWLKIAELSGVDFIPAREIHSMASDIFEKIDPAEDTSAYEIEEKKILAAMRDGEMLRMEQVAPAEIKHERSSGQPMGNGTFYSEYFDRDILNLFEDRFYSTLQDLAEDRIRAYARPVIQPRMIEGSFRGEDGAWPEEFRVYVRDGEITGVSNYYPQVEMTPEKHGAMMARAVGIAQTMIDFMTERSIACDNAHFRMPDEETFSCTLDFLVQEDGALLFLEGGPEGGRGAHPCCFLGPEGFKTALEGAVFSEEGRVWSLDDLLSGQIPGMEGHETPPDP